MKEQLTGAQALCHDGSMALPQQGWKRRQGIEMPLMLPVSREERPLKLLLCRGHLIGAERGFRKGGAHGTHWQRGSLSQRSSRINNR